jgi:hypothetical protein
MFSIDYQCIKEINHGARSSLPIIAMAVLQVRAARARVRQLNWKNKGSDYD